MARTATKRAPANAPDKLARYRGKRHFDRTPEPSGSGEAPAPGRRFVVQRHRASRLHYDFRLELDGVLVSWAVPKGPTLDPAVRRMAVHVEDHPLGYFDFEGVIPAGEYGGGDVVVWDWGTWDPAPGKDPRRGIEDGDLHVDLHGEKLRGRFVLVRRGGGAQWLLLHKRDDDAVEGWDPEDHPRSVKTGRTNDEVAADPSSGTWHSNRGRGSAPSSDDWRPATSEEVAALDELGKAGEWTFQGKVLRLTNLDKVLFPPDVTKRDLIRYQALVAPFALPYLAGRPVNLHRYPNGSTKPGFWHKAHPSHAPEWMSSWRNEEADPGETECYSVIDSPPALAWMANYGALELHAWTSMAADPHRPTWAFVDIDPGPDTTRDELLALARLHRVALEHLGVEAGAKVTGKRGVQVWIPIEPRYSFDETRAWVEKLSKAIGSTVPELVSWQWRTSDRQGLARLDYTQNAINKTLVAPYSPRPAAGAPVSVPIEWDELDDPDFAPDRWTIDTVLDRLLDVGDPLARLVGREQALPRL